MISLTRHDDGFRATDPGKNTVRVRATAWEPDVSAPSIRDALTRHDIGPDDPDTTISGRADRLEFPPVHIGVAEVDGTEQTDFGVNAERTELAEDDYLLRIEANVRIFLRVESALTLRNDGTDSTYVEFPEPTKLSVSFESRAELPSAELTVRKEPADIARALSVLSASNDTTKPDRTWPSMRNRPPAITFGDTFHVPSEVERDVDDTGIELTVPPRLSYLSSAAPLVHYLGADVTVARGADPRLDVDGRIERLGHDRAFTTSVTNLLRRVFCLDCVARTAGPHGGDLSVRDVFDTLELDADRVYHASMSQRVQTYLDAPFDDVRDRFPEWHLSMYVEPTYEHLRVFPHFLGALPFVFRPSAQPLSEEEWLSLSLTGGGYESFELRPDPNVARTPPRESGMRDVSNVDLIDPNLGPGRTHGWLAPGVPVDGFKTYPEAFDNRDTYLDGANGPLSVTVVVNDTNVRQQLFETPDGPGMHDETDTTVEEYRRRAEELNIVVDVRRNITTDELARIFESDNDLVHFIGHHDEDGLDCLDGSLSASTISQSRAETFFLNACGSFPFGAELIRKGSVAGGATFESVSDDDAFAVGGLFASLVVLGFSFERALALASRKTIAPKDYVVIGDGTHRVLQSDDIVPIELQLQQPDTDRFSITAHQPITNNAGMQVNMMMRSDPDQYVLSGSVAQYERTRSEVVEILKNRDAPVLSGGELRWPDELLSQL